MIAVWFNTTSSEIECKAVVSTVLLIIFSDHYAVMPPLEQFMEIPGMDRRELFFRDIERGDIVILSQGPSYPRYWTSSLSSLFAS